MADVPDLDPTLGEEYDEDEDEDFNPDARVTDKQQSSSDESEAEQQITKGPPVTSARSQKRPRPDEPSRIESKDLDFENSGDEGIIKEGTKRERKRRRKNKDGQQDEDSGGEGGFVKTRSMRAVADTTLSKRSDVLSGRVTVDIDAVWERLKNGSIEPEDPILNDDAVGIINNDENDNITIKRIYKFAGKLHTETKVVPKSSAQAKAYLATKGSQAGSDDNVIEEPLLAVNEEKTGPDGQILSRPKRRISAWDPNPTCFVKGLPLAPALSKSNIGASGALKSTDKSHLGQDAELWNRAIPQLTMKFGNAALQPAQGLVSFTSAKQSKIQKLNVVDKSKLDWAEHVDTTEGAREELETARKDKRNYLERKDFMDRVEDKTEDDRAKARGVVR